MGDVRIGSRIIGTHQPPFMVAEVSANHRGSLETALALVDAAAEAGADAVKLQTYTADTLTLDSDAEEFVVHGGQWDGRTLHDLYSEGAMPWEWHAPIMQRCAQQGMECFSTPFDESAVDYLEDLGVPCYKVASFEVVHLPLLRRIGGTGKPVVVSTGMASLEEIAEAVDTLRHAGSGEIVLLACTSEYPARASDSDLRRIPDLAQRFECSVGLSDHTLESAVCVAAVALGATLIEKHVTLAREDGGVDSAFSIEPAELAELVRECTVAWEALGECRYGPRDGETASMPFRRSLYFVRDLEAGDVIGPEDVRVIRPGFGLPPKYLEDVLGRVVTRNVRRASPVNWDVLQ